MVVTHPGWQQIVSGGDNGGGVLMGDGSEGKQRRHSDSDSTRIARDTSERPKMS